MSALRGVIRRRTRRNSLPAPASCGGRTATFGYLGTAGLQRFTGEAQGCTAKSWVTPVWTAVAIFDCREKDLSHATRTEWRVHAVAAAEQIGHLRLGDGRFAVYGAIEP